MVKPLTFDEIGLFLQSVVFGFENYIFFAFCLMIAFAVATGIRNLLVWGS